MFEATNFYPKSAARCTHMNSTLRLDDRRSELDEKSSS